MIRQALLIGVLVAVAPRIVVAQGGQNPPEAKATWEVIQHEILDSNCVSCHSAGSSFARQSDLVLSEDLAYSSLVDIKPRNSSADEDGLLRVSSEGGAPGLFQSFLWEKINVPEQDHLYTDHPNYGAIMPLGAPPLTDGQLELFRSWILAGAPETGAVADPKVLENTNRFERPEFVPLEPPEQGIQLHLGPFEVWPAEVHDREFFYFEPYETTEDILIGRYEISYRPGSHHLIVFNYPKGKPTPPPQKERDLRDQNGNIDLRVALQLADLFPFSFFVGTQVPFINYSFPPGVALRLPAGSGFDLDSHSVNRTDEPQIGEAYVNLHTLDPSEVDHVADYDNFGNFNISLPPNRVTTIEKTFRFDDRRNIIQMWSHSHEKTVEFRIERVGGEHDGELLYWTNDWEHPPLLEFDPPLTFERGDQIKLVTTYDNTTDELVTYGPLSTDEMQFLFYIYYQETLKAGDADQDLDFDQLDLVQVQIAAKYLTGQAATWGEGDWNGAPGGSPGNPPAGNGFFDQLDVVAALGGGAYLTGPYAAVQPNGQLGDDQTSVIYNAGTGEVAVDAPAGVELTSINIDSASSIFTGAAASNLGGSFDNDTDDNIFKATFGASFGSLTFGNVAPAGLSEEFLLSDLSVVGSLAGGGDLGDVDLVYVPQPTSALLLIIGAAIGLLRFRGSHGQR